jgi:uncharacterized protein
MSMSNTLCWVDIPVVDLDRAIGFYSAVLAATVSKQSGPGFEFGLLPHANNNASGSLSAMEKNNRPSEHGPLIYLSVEGRLDDAARAVGANGGKVVQPKFQMGPHGYRVVIVDSEGNRIALHSHAG